MVLLHGVTRKAENNRADNPAVVERWARQVLLSSGRRKKRKEKENGSSLHGNDMTERGERTKAQRSEMDEGAPPMRWVMSSGGRSRDKGERKKGRE